MALRKSTTFKVAAIAILALATTISCDDETPIPEDKAQVSSWFAENVKPLEERKGTLNTSLVEAEANQKIIKVRKDGSGDFRTLTDAIMSVPIGNKQRVVIVIGPGTYVEKVSIERGKDFITLIGETAGPDMPVLEFNGDAQKYGTFFSASLQVDSEYFVCANMVIKNSSPPPDGKRELPQAVAFRIGGDKATLYNCRFLGFQDTLCDQDGVHFFKDCYIEGNIDFIFGNGRSLYLNSEIHALDSHANGAVIVAHGKKIKSEQTGYSFVHSNIKASTQKITLGRAWFESPEVVFAYTDMPREIDPVGWTNNGFPERDETIFYGEYKNLGPGADMKERMKITKQLNDEEAKNFISLRYIKGSSWLLPPPTVPNA